MMSPEANNLWSDNIYGKASSEGKIQTSALNAFKSFSKEFQSFKTAPGTSSSSKGLLLFCSALFCSVKQSVVDINL